MALNRNRFEFKLPLSYDDCLYAWLNAPHGSTRPVLCVGGSPRPRVVHPPECARVIAYATQSPSVIDIGYAIDVAPVASAGHSNRGPNAFSLFYRFQPWLDRQDGTHSVEWGSVWSRDDSAGIGEHYKLSCRPRDASLLWNLLSPSVRTETRALRLSGLGVGVRNCDDSRTVAHQSVGGREIDSADLLAVAILDEPGRMQRPVGLPVSGTRLANAPGVVHEGTIILPNGTIATNVYNVEIATSPSGATYYVADVDDPLELLSVGRSAPPSPRRPYGAAGALAALGALTARSARRR